MQEPQASIALQDVYISSIESQRSTQPDASLALTASDPADLRIDNDGQPERALLALLTALTAAVAHPPTNMAGPFESRS